MYKRTAFLFLIVLLALQCMMGVCYGQIMPPSEGEPGIYEGARSAYYRDGDLDRNIQNLTARMRNGTVSYQEAESKLYNYYQSAIKRKANWEDNFSPSQNSTLYYAVDNMLKLQVQRCYELLDATKYEHRYGYNEAKWKWNAELETYHKYKNAVKKVGRLL